MTDPIADMITRIKNALMAQKREVEIPHSRMKESIAKLLLENKYIESYKVSDTKPQPQILITLKYLGKTAAISDVRRISKPGRRIYATVKQIPRALGGYGITIVSTSKGVMIDTEARKQNVGGEVLCQIW